VYLGGAPFPRESPAKPLTIHIIAENLGLPLKNLVGECIGDMDEAAGAADAIACSRDGYFLSYKICVLSDNRLQ
jgi:hypothetical protein